MSLTGLALIIVCGFVGSVVGIWFFIIWLPFQIHMLFVGYKYGWPAKKQSLIRDLFIEGSLFSISYIEATYDPNSEFSLMITGTFGRYIRRSRGDRLYTDAQSPALPARVAEAFDGYGDSVSGVVWLLWDPSFFQQLLKAGRGRIEIRGDMPESLMILAK